MHPRGLHAKVMDPKLRCCSNSISFFFLFWIVSMHPGELHARVMDPKIRFCSAFFFWIAQCIQGSSMPKSWIPNSDFVRIPFRFFFVSELSQCIQGSSMPKSWIPKSDFVCIPFCFFWFAQCIQGNSMPKSWITKSDFVRTPFSFFVTCLNASKGDPGQSHGSQDQILFVFHVVVFFSELFQCIQENSIPKSWIPKSDFVRIPFVSFFELSQWIQGTPCQSNGYQNQMLFVFNFISLFVLNGFNISKTFNAKVMDHKIRFYSYFMSFFVSELFHFIMSMWDTIITSSSVTTSNLNTRETWNINSDHKHEHPNRNLDHNHNQMQIPD